MSVLLTDNRNGRAPGIDRNGVGKGIIIHCPKCQAKLSITGFRNDEPLRCITCAYPLITRTDLLQVVAACKKLSSADQVSSAVRILEKLADFIPEAGTALGVLANQYTLPVGDLVRWNKLISAYATGDENAHEWLNRMCQSNPEIYGKKICKNCGAQKYFIRGKASKTICNYCQSVD